jgi:hypothetical protein
LFYFQTFPKISSSRPLSGLAGVWAVVVDAEVKVDHSSVGWLLVGGDAAEPCEGAVEAQADADELESRSSNMPLLPVFVVLAGGEVAVLLLRERLFVADVRESNMLAPPLPATAGCGCWNAVCACIWG